MKSILVIGIGRFGKHLCENLVKNGNDVMAVDEVEEKLEDIQASAFESCTGIRDITLPENVKSVGNDAFGNCNAVEKVTVLNNNCKFGSGNALPPKAVICCQPGSTAAKYAQKNLI